MPKYSYRLSAAFGREVELTLAATVRTLALTKQPKYSWKVLYPSKGKPGSRGGSWYPVAFSLNFASRTGSIKKMGAFPDFLLKCFWSPWIIYWCCSALEAFVCLTQEIPCWQTACHIFQHRIWLFTTALGYSYLAQWKRQEHIFEHSLMWIKLRLH